MSDNLENLGVAPAPFPPIHPPVTADEVADALEYLRAASTNLRLIVAAPTARGAILSELARVEAKWTLANTPAEVQQAGEEIVRAAIAIHDGTPSAPDLPASLASRGGTQRTFQTGIAPTWEEIGRGAAQAWGATPLGFAAKSVLGPDGAVATGIRAAMDKLAAPVKLGLLALTAWGLYKVIKDED